MDDPLFFDLISPSNGTTQVVYVGEPEIVVEVSLEAVVEVEVGCHD